MILGSPATESILSVLGTACAIPDAFTLCPIFVPVTVPAGVPLVYVVVTESPAVNKASSPSLLL